MENMKLILNHVYKSFDQGSVHLTILKDIDLIFSQGDRYAITGISGAGKSTLMHILAGLDTPTSGTVAYNNLQINKISSLQKSRFLNKSLGLVFQFPYLIRELTVKENIIIPGALAGKSEKECHDRALYLLEQVGLASKENAKPATLSGGQQQRVAIARALFNEPSFLLADEPTGNLDYGMGKEILNLLIRCQENLAMGLIINTHDEYVANAMNHIFTLRDGILEKIK